MKNIFTFLCALLVSVVLLNTSVNAHTVTTDSAVQVELGSVFQFPVEDRVTRQVCPKVEYIDMALGDIAKMSPRKAHHFLFHDAVRRPGTGTQKLKRGYSKRTKQVIIPYCKGLGPTKFAPTKVIKEMNIHGYKVSVVAIYESYKDKEGVFYSWFVNTQIVEPTYPVVRQRVLGRDYLTIGHSARISKGILAFTSLDLVQEIFSSASKQPKFVGRRVLQDPGESFMAHNTRVRVLDEAERGWVHEMKDGALTFSEFVESRQIHGLNVSILAFDIPSAPSGDPYRLYTWVVDIEIIEPKSKK